MNEVLNYEAVLIQGVTTMNWDQIKSNWIQVCDKIRVTTGRLSEDDLAAIAGRRDLLSDMLQQRCGYATVLAETKVDDFAQRSN